MIQKAQVKSAKKQVALAEPPQTRTTEGELPVAVAEVGADAGNVTAPNATARNGMLREPEATAASAQTTNDEISKNEPSWTRGTPTVPGTTLMHVSMASRRAPEGKAGKQEQVANDDTVPPAMTDSDLARLRAMQHTAARLLENCTCPLRTRCG